MNENIELHTWRLATVYCGLDTEKQTQEKYNFNPGGAVSVYVVPSSWIERSTMPEKFFNDPSNRAVGCVKTSYHNADDQMVPCVIYNLEDDQPEIREEVDPILYVIEMHIHLASSCSGMTIIQSNSNPWYIGTILHCETVEDVHPLPWAEEDLSLIYGIDEPATAEND